MTWSHCIENQGKAKSGETTLSLPIPILPTSCLQSIKTSNQKRMLLQIWLLLNDLSEESRLTTHDHTPPHQVSTTSVERPKGCKGPAGGDGFATGLMAGESKKTMSLHRWGHSAQASGCSKLRLAFKLRTLFLMSQIPNQNMIYVFPNVGLHVVTNIFPV